MNDIRLFFEAEIANESNGGDSPATIQTALDSLAQMPDDVLEEMGIEMDGETLYQHIDLFRPEVRLSQLLELMESEDG